MPEGPEIRIMSDFINQNCRDKTFDKSFHVEKGNNPIEFKIFERYKVSADSNGKELSLILSDGLNDHVVPVFMGMSGNWKWLNTKDWNNTPHCRLRLDTLDGYSLLLYGSYMGPKYKIDGKFNGVKRGYDPTKNFDLFKNNVLSNLNNRKLNKPVAEVLMNQEYFSGVGAYLNSEILGRLDINPFRVFNTLSSQELDNIFDVVLNCLEEAYQYGGGELMDWSNPFGSSKIDKWIRFYGNSDICYKHKFGDRNIWIQKKFKLS